MKIISTLGLLAALSLTGCGKSAGSATATNATAGDLIAAPVEYLGAVGQAQQRAVKTIDTVSLNSAIQQFYAAEDRFPKDLKELVTKGYIREIPNPPNGMKINYDAATGVVKLVKQQ